MSYNPIQFRNLIEFTLRETNNKLLSESSVKLLLGNKEPEVLLVLFKWSVLLSTG
jgi:hypothetical protein